MNEQLWPKITIVTPSYNQGQFLEETIHSVLDQGYPNLEYIIVDGGSTDNSVEIIRKYEKHLAWWVSEKDRGQAHAINKGFARATGDVIGWLNSDDCYMPGALHTVAKVFTERPDVHALVGHMELVDKTGRLLAHARGRYEGRLRLLQHWRGYAMHQPSIFWRRAVMDKIGLLNESLHLILDFDYWARIARYFQFENIDAVLSYSHYHEKAKTGDSWAGYHRDLRRNAWRYAGMPWEPDWWRFWWSWCWDLYLREYVQPIMRLGRRTQRQALRWIGR